MTPNVGTQMRHLALLLVLSAQAAYADPAAGTYVSRQKNICIVGPPGPSGKMTLPDCSLAHDELKVVNHGTHYSVDLSMIFANGHTCEFSGIGKLQGRRLVAVDSDQPSCPLTLALQGGKVQLTQPDECRYNYCGARGAINGAALSKRDAR